MKHKWEGVETKLFRERDSLEEPHEGAEILETREELGLQQRCMFRKGKGAVENDAKENWSGFEAERGVE